MLIDFVLRTPDQTADELVQSLVEGGIEAVVFDGNDNALGSALTDSTITGFPASIYQDEAAILFALGTNQIDAASDDLESWQAAITDFDGAIIANHPYDRNQGRPWGDRIYRLKGLTHVATTSNAGERSRDKLAVSVATKRSLGCISGSMGDRNAVGKLATFVDEDSINLEGLLSALSDHRTLNCELEDANTPYVPREEPKERPGFRAESDRDGGRDRGRGRGRDRGRQGRGPRRR